ncbi:MAG: LCP family protein [Anaerolineales bacterium]|uniref:LCP family protein n=1 Tax=Candidatus Desulfolinea nitratireducens TaxID=2841698 RepID=A0A8J6THN8_9CHLR|nr:LCP family protein [Candidatus Desulfolinea nitratireducens]
MLSRFRYLLLGFLLAMLVGCQNAPPPSASPAKALPYILVTPNLQATVTPTPFKPDYSPLPTLIEPAPLSTITASHTSTLPVSVNTPVPTNTPTASDYITATPNFYGNVWEDFPPPSVYPLSTTIPFPVGMLSQPANQINILLLGSDIRPNSSGFRTDTIILLTINKDLGTVNLTSFPRDLYVYIPGWTMQRINTAMSHGDFHTLAMTMAYNFGVYPDHYVMINFSNFVKIINSLGGIEVEVKQDFSDQRTGYSWYQVKKGTVHMDGDTALWYIRSRYTSSDIDRLRRAQEVIQAVGYRLLSFNVLTRAPDLYKIYKDSVFTDLGLGDISRLLPAANILVNTQNINRYVIGYGPVYDWTEPYTGAMVLLPNGYKIMPIMREALNVK